MHTIKTIIFILTCAALLCACGNKGPLYLPDEETTVEKTSAAKGETEKEDENEDKDKENSAPR